MFLTDETFLFEQGLEAVRTQEETLLLKIIDKLSESGVKFFSDNLSQESAGGIIDSVQFLGIAAAEAEINSGVLNAAVSLGIIGQEAARNRNNEAVLKAVLALKALGEKTACMETLFSFHLIAISLKEVGKEAVRRGMEKEAIKSQSCLKELYTFYNNSKNEFETFNENFFFLIRDIGRCAADAGLEEAAINAAALMEDF